MFLYSNVPFSFCCLIIFAALRIYTSSSYQPSTTVSSVARSQFDFFYFARDVSTLPGCSNLIVSVTPSNGGDPDLLLSNRQFTSTGGCSSSATLCVSSGSTGADAITLLSTVTSSTGYFYAAVQGYSAAAYVLALEWRGSNGACSVGTLRLDDVHTRVAHFRCTDSHV